MIVFFEKVREILETVSIKVKISNIIISILAVALSMMNINILGIDIVWVAIFLCGLPIVLEAICGLVLEFDIKADVLVSLALIASIIIGEYFAAGEIAVIMQIGSLLEELTVKKAQVSVERLVKLKPLVARKVIDTDVMETDIESIKIGDIIRVIQGDTVPLDGEIVKGDASLNQAVITGESLPVDRSVGSEVFSGTKAEFGSFDMKVTKLSNDSSIQKIIRLVEAVEPDDTKSVKIADKMATIIVILAVLTAIGTVIFTGEIIRGVTILVVFCPCALVLATPTAIMAAVGKATKYGFLVKDTAALESLANVKNIAFDKTGTLTTGKLRVSKIESLNKNFTSDEMFYLAASVESLSEHPIGKAVVESYKKNCGNELVFPRDFNIEVGKGIRATIEENAVLIGNKNFIQDELDINLSKEITYTYDGSIVVYMAVNKEFVGLIELSDSVRETSVAMVSKIKDLSIKPIMITGDDILVAENIGEELAIDEIISNCLPEDKMEIISSYKDKNEKICMVGDGINDAPSLRLADVGIAMGKMGSDTVLDSAKIVIIEDKIQELPRLIKVARSMVTTIKGNIAFSIGLNIIAIGLSIIGTLDPIMGALVHNMGSVLVIINSSLILSRKY